MKGPRISLFIIAKNEEKNIQKCILSARDIVHEIIVVDGFSRDKTPQLAKELGAQVYRRRFDGFTNQKNFALSKVNAEWALNLDADERLTPELRKEIEQILPNTHFAGFHIPFANYFLGKKMRFSGLSGETHIRLVRTRKAKYVGGLVHEGLEVKGPLGKLKSPINHFSYDTIDTYFHKFNKYTTLAAQQMHSNGKRFSLLKLLFILPFEFAKRYVLKLGILDGVRGLFWASFSTFYVFVKYAKLWQITKGKK